MRLAFVHDWLTVPGGSEKVLIALHELYPDAPIFTTIYKKDNFPELANAKVIPSYLDKLPFARNHHQIFIPLMPRAVESYNLKDYDLIISDSHACAKGVIKSANATHLCYCHTPLRYVWEPSIDPRASSTWLKRLAAKRLKKWDLATVNRVDKYYANSRYIKDRIKKIYDREADVIYPPVETSKFQPVSHPDSYFLYSSRLVAYKHPEIVVEAFNQLNLPLKIVGSGPELAKLREIAKPNIEFLGRVSDRDLPSIYARCQALIFPAIEDFGIVPVEVMAAGRPVIALNQGGATETVVEGKTGLHFNEQSPESIIEAVKKFRPENFNSQEINTYAKQFDTAVFKTKMLQLVQQYSR